VQLASLPPARLGTAAVIADQRPPDAIAEPALERGFRARLARLPQGPGARVAVTPTTVLTVPVKPAPAVELPGTPVGARHPAPGAAAALVRVWGTGEWDQMNTGSHGLLSPVAQTPRGEQSRVSNVRGNTYRLPPEPWDAAQFVGYRPAPDEV
jgi:hypothetical protein